jgi:hypothetical protein
MGEQDVWLNNYRRKGPVVGRWTLARQEAVLVNRKAEGIRELEHRESIGTGHLEHRPPTAWALQLHPDQKTETHYVGQGTSLEVSGHRPS